MKLEMLALLLLSISAGASPHHCKPTKIAVVDTGLDLSDPRFKSHLCKTGHRNFVPKETMNDTVGHGTHVAGLVQEFATDVNYCILIYKYYQNASSSAQNVRREILALQAAIDNGATVINFSGGGPGFNDDESKVIKNNPQVTFVVAAGNEGQNLDTPGNEYYPASYFYPNLVVVGAVGVNGIRTRYSNYGKHVENWELGEEVISTLPCDVNEVGSRCTGRMSGTSQATAIFSGKLVAKKSNSCEYSHNDN